MAKTKKVMSWCCFRVRRKHKTLSVAEKPRDTP